jgi:phosphate ABC transporter phosphate-binding protein
VSRSISYRSRGRRTLLCVVGTLFAMIASGAVSRTRVSADSYARISGEGSSWAANAIDAMRVNVAQNYGITVDYNPSGSTSGRKNFLNGTIDFAASDIPFQFSPEDGSAPENPAPNSYAYMPVVAGGTAFMYNLKINGKRVTNLRLSGTNVAKLFTGAITSWDDPAIQADNPGLVMPARPVVPVVRADGSGSSAQFSLWMIKQYPDIWNNFCQRSGRSPACGETSFYPITQGMIAQQGDPGIAGYVSQNFAEGAIGYVNYSYALNTQFPVAKVLNAAGYYTEPTPQNVAVSLLQAQINTDATDPKVYLTQQLDGVYKDTDPRNYQLSSYSYLILPTTVAGQFNEAKGKTLGAFSYYAMCEAQQSSASLGYSPMPINLVQAGFDQIRKIPGVVVQAIDIKTCKNPTFAADGSNLLADSAPKPLACDQQGGPTQCANGTGGMSNVPTAVLVPVVTGGGAGGAPAAGGTPAAGGSAAADPNAPTNPAVAGTGTAADPATASAAANGAPADPGAAAADPGAASDPNAAANPPGAGPGAANASGSVASPGLPSSPGGVGTAGDSGGSVAATPIAVTSAGGATVPGTATGVAGGAATAAGGTPRPATPSVTLKPATAEPGVGSCDADTGLCRAGATAQPTAGDAAAAGAVGATTTTTLNRSSSSGASFALVLLVILFVFGLVLAPALAWRHFSVRQPA